MTVVKAVVVRVSDRLVATSGRRSRAAALARAELPLHCGPWDYRREKSGIWESDWANLSMEVAAL
jgi:hypothetical protein